MVPWLNSIKTNQGFKRYFQNTSWVFIEKLFRMFIGFFIGIWIARYLGPEQLGILSYAQSMVAIFAIFSSLGLDGIVVRELVKNQKKRDEFLGAAFLLKIIGSIVSVTLIYILVNNVNYEKITSILVIVISISTIFYSFQVIEFYFQANILSKYSTYANLFALAISSLLKVLFIILNMPLIYFAITIVLEAFFIAVFHIYFYHKKMLYIRNWKYNFTIIKKLLFDSWPFIFSAFAVVIYMKIDIIMIKSMLDNNAVGQYTVGIRFSEVWSFIPVVVSASLFPAIINAKMNQQLYRKRLENLYMLMIWIAIPIAIVVALFSNKIITFFFGNQYLDAIEVLQIHIWSNVFIFLLVASGKWFIAENYGIHALLRNISGATVNILLNYLLLPKYGIVGAAYATLISYAIAALLYDLTNKQLRESFWMKIHASLLLPLWSHLAKGKI